MVINADHIFFFLLGIMALYIYWRVQYWCTSCRLPIRFQELLDAPLEERRKMLKTDCLRNRIIEWIMNAHAKRSHDFYFWLEKKLK